MSKTKYVKVFEELDQEGSLEPELRPGKKRALARGDDVLTEAQYAACYLNAVENASRQEDTRGRGDSPMTRAALKMQDKEADKDFRKMSAAKLSVYLGLKPQTVERNVSKFKLLLSGNREGTPSNVLYPEIIEHFDKFKAMSPADVLTLAEEALDYNGDDTQYQEYLAKMSGQASKARGNKVLRTRKIGSDIKSLYGALRGKFGNEKAMKIAIDKVSQEKDIPRPEIILLAKEFFKGESSLRDLLK